MPEILFDKLSHKYSIDGQKIPSVTQIISFGGASTDYSKIPKWILKRAAEIGDLTHNAVRCYFEENANLITNDLSVAKYLDAFTYFMSKNDFVCRYTEMLMYCECHRFAGTVDLVGLLNGAWSIVDLKTTNKINQEYVELQTAGYRHLCETFFRKTFFDAELEGLRESPPETFFDRNIIHLKKSGVGSVVDCVDDGAWPQFEKLVETYWKENS